jgi:hypothetical protein
MNQLDWVKLAQKNKYLGTYRWTTTSNAEWMNFVLSLSTVERLIPIGKDFNSFMNFSHLMFSLKPTTNAMMAGLTKIFFDNSPRDDFLNLTYGIDFSNNTNLHRIYQYPGEAYISPNNSNEINFLIPLNFPFLKFKWGAVVAGNSDAAMSRYHREYVFGILKTAVISQLVTKTSLTEITYTLSGQFLDLSTSGVYFDD